jgi:hypothetical protein
MRSMRNLTSINLSNNWLNGTLPDWLNEFEQVRLLLSTFSHQRFACCQPVMMSRCSWSR